MTGHRISSAKIARPAVTGVVRRSRLFPLLDRGEGKPVTWISAPGGAGKTTLVASYLEAHNLPCIWYQCDDGDADIATFFYYMGLAAKKAAPRYRHPLPLLTPEYLAGIPAFTRRFFDILCSRVSTIVLDNYQDVPLNSPFHEMMALGVESLPADVRLVVISRAGPPPALAGQQAKGRINPIAFHDIRFTFDESRELAHALIPTLDPQCIQLMHARTEGWAAGIILMLEKERFDGNCLVSPEKLSHDRVFDYFAGEIFVKVDRGVQDFLLKTAFPHELTAPLAEKLTAVGDAEQILSALSAQHFFTDRLAGSGREYKYHPLFREFLLNRAKSVFSPDELTAIRRNAGQHLEQAGRIEDAARLYCEARDRNGLGRMVKRHARELLLQGRNRIVAEWLECIPGGLERDPWLLYWKGLCSFPVDLPRTRMFLEKALAAFRKNGDCSGVYLSWAGIVDTYAFSDEWLQLDDCLAEFEELWRRYPSFSSLDDELIASSRMLLCLTLRRTDQPRLVEHWLLRVTVLLQEKPCPDIQMDTVFCMSVYYLWKGEYDKNAVLLERAAAEIRHHATSPFTVIRIKLMKGIHYWVTAEYDAARQTLAEALDVSAQNGVHLYDSLLWSFTVAAEMASGNLESAGLSLRNQMNSLVGRENALNVFFYHINSAWRALLTNNLSHAAGHMETVFATVEQRGTPYYRALWHIGMAQVSFLQGKVRNAHALIQTAHRISLSMKSRVMEWYSLIVESWFLLREGKNTEGLLSLHRGLSLGRRHGYVHLEFYQPSVMRYLFVRALEEKIEPEYVKRLIGKMGLTPPLPGKNTAVYCEEWPYPIKIYTLGRFEIVKFDEPLCFPGKEQKKPLELLKVLIAFGGREVSRESVTDILWPDAEGDLAAKSFETTLGRLRKLLGGDEYITSRARQLTLNPLYCWVDTCALEAVLDEFPAVGSGNVAQLSAKAVGLYKGPFLAAEGGSFSWAVSRREILMNRLLKVIGMAGNHYVQAGDWEAAADYFAKGIEVDDLAEEFYRRLIICHRHLGNSAAVVRTYNRCRNRLAAELGIEPSRETTAVYSTVMKRR